MFEVDVEEGREEFNVQSSRLKRKKEGVRRQKEREKKVKITGL